MPTRRVFLIGLAASLSGCSRGIAVLPVGPADLIHVLAKQHSRVIRDPAAIEALRDFVNERLEGWVEEIGMPIPHTEMQFFNDGKALSTFGVGSGFFSRGAFPNQRTRRATSEELAEFSRLAHIE